MKNIQKRLRILEIYVAVSMIVFGVLLFTAFTQTKQNFQEITVERLNVVEKNGQLVAVIANSARMPDPVVDGKAFKTERPPGMIFYNGLGDENGGLVFGAVKGKDKYGAYGGFTFDQHQQSQAIGLIYNDHNGSREVGLKVWDRPEISFARVLERREAFKSMPAGAEKDAEEKKLREDDFSPTRIFVGKSKEKEAKITLYDANGKARINMAVDAFGKPKLEFLDETGKVIYSLPKDVGTSGK